MRYVGHRPNRILACLLASQLLIVSCSGCSSLRGEGRRPATSAETSKQELVQKKSVTGSPRATPEDSSAGARGSEKQSSVSPSEKQVPIGEKKASRKSSSRTRIDEQVREAAIKLAKSLKSVQGMKICHAVEEDEWWVIIYDDLGGVLDVKQYVWSPESESLEPFLVLKRIPRSKLAVILSSDDPGRKCRVVAPGLYRAD